MAQVSALQGPRLRGFYGIDVPWRVLRLFLYMTASFWGAYGVLRYGASLRAMIEDEFPDIPQPWPGLGLGIVIAALVFHCICYFYTLVATLHTSLNVRKKVARQMLNAVPDWSAVTAVLDLGCGRGVLLGTIARKLEKERAGGRVVGYDCWPSRSNKGRFDSGTMAYALKNTAQEGVGHIVTCKSGEFTKLPFADQYFDAVFSALSLNSSAEAAKTFDEKANLWKQALKEVGRVMKPGGQLIIWDLASVDEYAAILKAEDLWVDIRVLKGAVAFLMPTKVVLARKTK